jgi:serine/threonine-protein kinase RsbW/stage II sporulation protein AB (anti-sigma F factor)
MRFAGRFPAIPLGIAAIRGEMAAVARECGFDERKVQDVRLAVSEAATNAVVHGYRDATGTIHVSASTTDAELTIVVSDEGPGLMPRTDSPGGGLGLPIIASLASRVELVSEGDGTHIHMVFPLPARSAG